MFELDANDLRELATVLGEAHTAVDAAAQRPPASWWALIHSAKAAAAAHPSCPCCKGYGEVTLFPTRNNPDDPPDGEERPCPVCRPWRSGFNGWRGNSDPLEWIVPPYAPGRRAEAYRGRTLMWSREGQLMTDDELLDALDPDGPSSPF